MVDLVAKSPAEGLLPVELDGLVLRELDHVSVWSVAPYSGAETSVSADLKKATKLTLPKVGKSSASAQARVLWTGRGQFFLLGAAPPKLKAAVSDQSDAWCAVSLDGEGGAAVMARLCPLDLRSMEVGDVSRSLIGHMPAIILRTDTGFELMVFRAFAKTLVHEMTDAMRSVSAQAGIET